MVIGTWLGIPWWIRLLGGAAIAAVLALLLSNAVFRPTGVYFSIGALVVPETLRMVFYLWRPVGGALQDGIQATWSRVRPRFFRPAISTGWLS